MPLVTTLGPLSSDELGIVLPHEHVFVDLRVPSHPRQGIADAQEVIRLMRPELERARQAGIGAIVEATPLGVGRRADIVLAVSRAAGFPIVVPTGVYREPWIPEWIHRATEHGVYDWLMREFVRGIDSTGVQPGWIMLGSSDGGMTSCERRVLRAAGRAARETGAIVGSHTLRGEVVTEQLYELEDVGLAPERFIWNHAQAEGDFEYHVQTARRGAWIEYDSVGSTPEADAHILDLVLRVLSRGLESRLLLSQDRGWYDPARPGGGTPRPYTYLVDVFLPQLRARGVAESTIDLVTRTNPYEALAR